MNTRLGQFFLTDIRLFAKIFKVLEGGKFETFVVHLGGTSETLLFLLNLFNKYLRLSLILYYECLTGRFL